jgi:hypothetical protein
MATNITNNFKQLNNEIIIFNTNINVPFPELFNAGTGNKNTENPIG